MFTLKIKILKRLALALVCVSAAPVYASDWQFFTKVAGEYSYWFFDRATVSKQGGVVTLWLKPVQDLSKPVPSGIYSEASKNTYVCSKRTYQTLTSSTYDKDGEFIRANPNQGRVLDIAPDTIAERILETVCTTDFPNNKSEELYYPATNNDPLKHAANIFEWVRARETDPAPK